MQRVSIRLGLIVGLIVTLTLPSLAQSAWNDSATMVVIDRAIGRRQEVVADSGLIDYRARAHGFVFFLGQFGQGLVRSPRLIKSDQLELEVYWKAPNLSKQRIIGWRDRRDLPTDIQYHQDHLGIVQSNFGDVIRLGEGDEVRDVPHPVSPIGRSVYDFALRDSLEIALPQRNVRVYEVVVRPRQPDRPRIIGTVLIDADEFALVRMAFSFTAASYLDSQLEDISIVLDNALWDGRFWLPYRQEIEIRRRAQWLELPVRGIIRGRWEIDDYMINQTLPVARFRGQEIVAAPPAVRDTFPWDEQLDRVIADAATPVTEQDLREIRQIAAELAAGQYLSGLAPARLGADRLSDLLRSNRVEGVAVGIGLVWRPLGDDLEFRPRVSYGFSDTRLKGGLAVRSRLSSWQFEAEGHRYVRDIADLPIMSRLVNSFASQEFGLDAGDYYLATGVSASITLAYSKRGTLSVQAGTDDVDGLEVLASPAMGSFRDNPPLGVNDRWRWAALRWWPFRRHAATGINLDGDVMFELGESDRSYRRLWGWADLSIPAGATTLEIRGQAGAASGGVPVHRLFALGGRGTLLGEPYRAYGGREMVLMRLEWSVAMPFLDLGLGALGDVAGGIRIGPYLAAGVAARPVPGSVWRASGGMRPVVGLSIELFRVLEFEIGASLRGEGFGLSFDLTPELWDIL